MNKFYVICFDIAEKKRLRQVAIQMENFGQRVQHSLFECYLSNEQKQTLEKRLARIIKPDEDHIRYYHLCHKDYKKIQLKGRGEITPNASYYLL